jgi:hypothetical protein
MKESSLKQYRETLSGEVSKAQRASLYSAIPFVGLYKVIQIKVIKGISLHEGLFRPLVDVNKGWVGRCPRPPLLDESLMIERLLGGGELPWTIMDRIEQNGVGAGKARHGSVEER